jgi:hypothetical protein
MKMQYRQSFAISFDAPSVRHHSADVAGRLPCGGVYGPAFTRHAQRIIQSAIESLTRHDDLVEDGENVGEKLLEQLSLVMTPAQIDEAAQLFDSDMQDVMRHAASAMKTASWPAMPRHCRTGGNGTSPRSALINTLV